MGDAGDRSRAGDHLLLRDYSFPIRGRPIADGPVFGARGLILVIPCLCRQCESVDLHAGRSWKGACSKELTAGRPPWTIANDPCDGAAPGRVLRGTNRNSRHSSYDVRRPGKSDSEARVK